MAEFVGGKPISVGIDEPITFKNKTDTAFDVSCGIVFRKSGLYRVSIVGRHISVAVEPERKKGHWIEVDDCYNRISGRCSVCGWESHLYEDDVVGMNFCPNCGADMRQREE